MTDGMIEIVKSLSKLPDLLKMIYDDLLKPGVCQIGIALESVLGLGNTILFPIALVNAKAGQVLKKNMEKLRGELAQIPESEVVPVAPEIGVPVLEKLTYVHDDELSMLYIRLLAQAANKKRAKFAHPGFINIINNISPDEAVILQKLNNGLQWPFLTLKISTIGSSSFLLIEEILTGIEFEIKIIYPENMQAYFSNVEGLGLIKSEKGTYVVDKEVYRILEKKYSENYERLEYDKSKEKLVFEKGLITVTRFGSLFMQACLPWVTDETVS